MRCTVHGQRARHTIRHHKSHGHHIKDNAISAKHAMPRQSPAGPPRLKRYRCIISAGSSYRIDTHRASRPRPGQATRKSSVSTEPSMHFSRHAAKNIRPPMKTTVDVSYFGPLPVSCGAIDTKRYVCLCTCMFMYMYMYINIHTVNMCIP